MPRTIRASFYDGALQRFFDVGAQEVWLVFNEPDWD